MHTHCHAMCEEFSKGSVKVHRCHIFSIILRNVTRSGVVKTSNPTAHIIQDGLK